MVRGMWLRGKRAVERHLEKGFREMSLERYRFLTWNEFERHVSPQARQFMRKHVPRYWGAVSLSSKSCVFVKCL